MCSSDLDYAAPVSFVASKSLSSANVSVTCDGKAIAGSVTVVGALVTFSPVVPAMTANAKCVASVLAAGTIDTSGNSLAADITLAKFTVKPLNCIGNSINSPPNQNGIPLIAACGNVFVDVTLAQNKYPIVTEAIKSAVEINKAFYGTLQLIQPDVITCESTACAVYFVGDSLRSLALPANFKAGQFTAPRNTVISTAATDPRTLGILAHEFAHFELSARLGPGKSVPAWFNEGLATYIGNEPNCTNVTAKGVSSLVSLESPQAWVTYTNNLTVIVQTYCQARTEVSAWITKRGKHAVAQLLEAVKQGRSFNAEYGALLTE